MSWAKWLHTYSGQRFLQISAITASIATFGAFQLPNSLFLYKYKEIVQCYEYGLGQPVPPKSVALYEQAVADLKVPKRERNLLEIFTVFGFDLFHAGSTVLVTGAIVGIPINFSYESVKDVNKKIKVGGKTVNWMSEEGTNLAESLVLSEDARRFGLAREVTSARSSCVWVKSIAPCSAIIFTYTTCRTLNSRFNYTKHPFRFIVYGLVSALSYSLYCLVTDVSTAFLENDADETAGQLSESYAKGGVEFYQKIKQRNQALRTLMGAEGEKRFTISGNDVVFIRQLTTPLSDRLRNLEKIVDSFSKTTNESE